MEYRQLGDTELDVSSFGMGCVTFGREIDVEMSRSILDHAFQRGITLFDTAEAYAAGASETLLGKWIADRKVRDHIVVATKVGPGSLTADRIIASAEASLRRLQVDRIDLYQLHVWDGSTPLHQTLQALNTLVESGKVRYLGCSNWKADQLRQALSICDEMGLARIRSVQPPYNLAQRDIEADLLPLCTDQQLGVLAYSPLGAGFLTGKYRRGQPVPAGTRFDVIPGHQPIYFTDHGFAILNRLEQAAEQSGRSMVQLALGWVLRQGGVTSMLIGARNPAQVDQVFEAEQADLDEPLQQFFGGPDVEPPA